VPLGKLKKERLVPVDSFVRQIIERLLDLRSQDDANPGSFLLPRNRARQTLIRNLRASFQQVLAAAGINTQLVPHQSRHYASELVRTGVGLPALMKLLGHVNPEMTMRYVDVVGSDLQREFHLADRNLAISRRNRKPRPARRAAAWTVSSIRCCSLNMPSRCSGVRYPTALRSIASTNSRTDWPKSSRKPASSNQTDSGQRLAV
jgi:hypothetical protein